MIYMDSNMTEHYFSYDHAAESFLQHIALEDMSIDARLQVEFELADGTDLFSNVAMEAIGETVKNMASKAKSNFVTYAKKLINFLFGWLIRFFQGTTNVKKAMSKSYEKAKVYMKKLNELETKARGANKEDKIEITDFGNCILIGLTMIQAIVVSSNRLGEALKEAYSQTSGTSENGDGKKTSTTRAFKLLNVMLDKLQTLYAVVGSIEISNLSNLAAKVRQSNFNISEMMTKYEQAGNKLKNKTVRDSRAEGKAITKQNSKGLGEKFSAQFGLGEKGKEVDKDTATVATNKLEGTYKARLEDTAKYMSEPKKAEMNLTEAFDELRDKMNMFMKLAKNNKWDLSKNIQAAEKVRRGLEKELSNISVTEVNDKIVSELLQRIVSVGNNLGQIQRSAGVVMKKVVSCIDGMTTDVAKLGSKLIKIGDTN